MLLPGLGHGLRQRFDTPRRTRFQAAPDASPTLRHLFISQVVGVIPKKVIRKSLINDRFRQAVRVFPDALGLFSQAVLRLGR